MLRSHWHCDNHVHRHAPDSGLCIFDSSGRGALLAVSALLLATSSRTPCHEHHQLPHRGSSDLGAFAALVPVRLYDCSATQLQPRACLVMNYRKHGNTVTLLITYTILVVPNYINSIVKPKSII